MLETLREYGLERLRQSAEEDLLRDRHRDWFVDFAETAELELWRPEIPAWLRLLECEHDNFRAALEWSTAPGVAAVDASGTPTPTNSSPAGLRLATALGRFWYLRGHFAEGRARLEAQLRAWSADGVVRSRALSSVASLGFFQGDYSCLRTAATEAVQATGAADDTFTRALAFLLAAVAAHVDHDEPRARTLVNESLRLWGLTGADVGYAYALYTLAEITWFEGDHDPAVSLMEEALATVRAGGDIFATGIFRARLAHLKLLNGDIDAAMALEQGNLAQRWSSGDRWGIAESLTVIALGALQLDLPEFAAVLLAAAEALWNATSGALFHQYVHEVNAARRAVADALGPEAFGAAWTAGERLPLEEAVARALAPIRSAAG
jgi:non-specific serine/threonine protein kinase